MFHTVYNSYEEKLNGRDYIGKHSTKDLNDGYLGSFNDQTFDPDHKIILIYAKTAQGAIWLEGQFQKVFGVVIDPQFANRATQTGTGFDRTGAIASEETKKKMSKSQRGKVRSEETKRKLSESHLGKQTGKDNPMFGRIGELHPMFGTTRSEETKRKMSKAQKGRVVTEEAKKKMSAAHTGRKCPEHSKRMLGDKNPNFGKKWFTNEAGESCMCIEPPGPEWQLGRKWKTQQS